MKIIVIGSGGRLGAALVREWRAAGDEVIGFDRAALDLGSGDAIRAALESGPAGQCDAVVNCAALTNVDYCETHNEEAMRINRDAVAIIGTSCAERKVRCIHISTDYVFGGEKRTPYVEEDAAGPLGVYAASKLAGEEALLATSTEHLAVRVSWVFGPDRPSFIDQILGKAQQSEEVAAIGDKWAVPTYTLDAAQWLRPLLERGQIGGLVHLCNAGECTWQEYGQYAIDCAAACGVPILGHTVAALKMADLKAFVAKRPVYTVMSTARLTAATGLKPRPWQDAVSEYVGRTFGAR